MRIALQISGRLRYTVASVSSIINAIIRRWQPDVFCSFWEPNHDDTLRQWIDHFRPIAIETENQSLVRPYLDMLFPFNVHANMPSMSYKFHRVATMRKGHESRHGVRYDCVIQARSDNLFFEPLEDQIMLPMLSPGVYCSNGSMSLDIDPYISPRMVDNFYLGDASNMDQAANTFWYLREQAHIYTEKGQLHHVRIPEIIQSRIWNDLGIPIRPLPGNNPFRNFYYDIDRTEPAWQ